MLIYRVRGLHITRTFDGTTGAPLYVVSVPTQHSSTHLTVDQMQACVCTLAADVAERLGVSVQTLLASQPATPRKRGRK